MTTLKLCGAIALLLFLVGCGASSIHTAYVYPVGGCGYRVYLAAGAAIESDVPMSACLPLNDAKELADKVNQQMAGKWSSHTP